MCRKFTWIMYKTVPDFCCRRAGSRLLLQGGRLSSFRFVSVIVYNLSAEPSEASLGSAGAAGKAEMLVTELPNMRKWPHSASNHHFPQGISPCVLICFLIIL